jgi:REP element-mobilizing transposase RayT
MDNHYHLLIETPEANASRALQWLNLSYAAWFNEGIGVVIRHRTKKVLRGDSAFDTF